MPHDHNHLNYATWECNYDVVFTPKYAIRCCLGKSGGTWALYSTSWPDDGSNSAPTSSVLAGCREAQEVHTRRSIVCLGNNLQNGSRSVR